MFESKRFFWITAMLVLGVTGCKQDAAVQAEKAAATEAAPTAGDKTAERPSGPVATVNGVPIDSAAFWAQIEKITQGGSRTIPEDRLQKIREGILARLIEEELISQEIRKQEIQVTDAELDQEFLKYKARFKGEEQFEQYLKHGKTTIDEIRKRLQSSLALTKLLAKMGKLDVSEEDVAKAYETGIKMYTDPAQVHAMHILVKVAEDAPAEQVTAAKRKIDDASARLRKGLEFADIAREVSDDMMTKEKGGDLGFFRRGQMVPQFEEAAFALKAGEMTKEPVRSRFGFHIIKVIERKEERVKPMSEVSDQIRDSLRNRAVFKGRREVVEQLKTAAKIDMHI